MTEILIHVHRNGSEEPHSLTIDEEATIEELLRFIAPEQHADLLVVVEEEDKVRERHQRLRECGIQHGSHVHCHPRVIHYEVDAEKQESMHHKKTAFAIMKDAGVDPETHYLIRLTRDRGKVSYENEPQKVVHLHNCMKFITASLGPTTVS